MGVYRLYNKDKAEAIFKNRKFGHKSRKDKSKIEEILTGNNVVELISENIEYLLTLIPEIKNMIGFEHKHPHHHLDVWQHIIQTK